MFCWFYKFQSYTNCIEENENQQEFCSDECGIHMSGKNARYLLTNLDVNRSNQARNNNPTSQL